MLDQSDMVYHHDISLNFLTFKVETSPTRRKRKSDGVGTGMAGGATMRVGVRGASMNDAIMEPSRRLGLILMQ